MQVIITPGSPGSAPQTAIAHTRQELDALEFKRAELRQQLSSNAERRTVLQVQGADARGKAAADIQARIAAIDARTARIDDELNATDDAIAASLARGITTVPQSSIGRGVTIMPVGRAPQAGSDLANLMFFNGLGFVLLGFAMWRWTRRRSPVTPTRLAPEDANRLEMLHSAVDVIALEVERISEGQRYVTKILNERSIGAGAAEEIPLRQGSEESARKAAKS